MDTARTEHFWTKIGELCVLVLVLSGSVAPLVLKTARVGHPLGHRHVSLGAEKMMNERLTRVLQICLVLISGVMLMTRMLTELIRAFGLRGTGTDRYRASSGPQ